MNKFYSRKFWIAVLSAALIIMNQKLNLHLSQESILSLTGVVMAYIFGQSYVDGKQNQPSPLGQPVESPPLDSPTE